MQQGGKNPFAYIINLTHYSHNVLLAIMSPIGVQLLQDVCILGGTEDGANPLFIYQLFMSTKFRATSNLYLEVLQNGSEATYLCYYQDPAPLFEIVSPFSRVMWRG